MHTHAHMMASVWLASCHDIGCHKPQDSSHAHHRITIIYMLLQQPMKCVQCSALTTRCPENCFESGTGNANTCLQLHDSGTVRWLSSPCGILKQPRHQPHLASSGFSSTDASMTPPPCWALGPVMPWMSSMNRMALGPAAVSSANTPRSRSSNSPGKVAPAKEGGQEGNTGT